ncbi:MAG: hypothetical protein QM809_16705 [Gordonia sp. (in: high G+C Gram-positive bacteria)]|uniref:hypothetical protein n=1 Tax=Gordonia sp. (in: high G+C Gram-positive bacteria) TaxID=84139 RepID=UPI0039E3D882
MEEPEISGLIGERLREAGQARNLSVSAIAGDDAKNSSSARETARPSLATRARDLTRTMTGRIAGRRPGTPSRLLDSRTRDGVTTEVRAVELTPDLSYVCSVTASSTAQVLVTRGRMRVDGDPVTVDGPVLSGGESCTWDGSVEHRLTPVDGAAAAILVIHRGP